MAQPSEPDDVEWLTPRQMRDWVALVSLLRALPASLDAQLKREAGINAFEYHVLASLSEAPDRRLPMRDLAALSGGSLSRLSHAVSRLETAGWVERRACAQAGHHNEARLTEEGWEKIQQAAPGHVREVRRLVIDPLTDEQLTALGSAARTIAEAADPLLTKALSNRPRATRRSSGANSNECDE